MSSATTPEIDPDITMDELSARLPGARRALFAGFHIGGCQSCGFSGSETLREVCRRNEDLDVDTVVSHLLASHEQDQRTLIAPEELARLLAADPDSVRVVDIRTREEFEAVHIPGAHLFSQDLLQEAFGGWDRGLSIVLCDHTGDRSLDAAAYFIGHGFENARSLEGGIDAYAERVAPELPRYRVEFDD